MKNLWSDNTSRNFWLCQPDPSSETWTDAIQHAIPILELADQVVDSESALLYTLGEMQFAPDQWQLSQVKRLYYDIKPLLPRVVINLIKNINSNIIDGTFPLSWPAETRYVQFQWEVIRQLLHTLGQSSINFRHFWPDGKRFSFVLTHDIETKEGQAFVRKVADLEEELGFRSSFNFVPERYSVLSQLIPCSTPLQRPSLMSLSPSASSSISFREEATGIRSSTGDSSPTALFTCR